MNINLKLSTESIQSAIRKLTKIQGYFEDDAKEFLSLLGNEGAEIAQAAYGNFGVSAFAIPPMNGETAIMVTGDMPAIAEFGAGDATIYPSALFDTSGLDAEVFPGSWSAGHAMEYVTLGEWRFAGRWMSEVEPHLGLYQAKLFLIEHSTEIAQEVFQFD